MGGVTQARSSSARMTARRPRNHQCRRSSAAISAYASGRTDVLRRASEDHLRPQQPVQPGSAKAVGEPLRVRIVDVLRRSEDPVCQCELIALFDMRQSLLSHHMKKLVDAGLVDVERRHRWAYYSIATDAVEELTAWLR